MYRTLECFSSPRSVRYDAPPRGDRRLDNRREVALDIKGFLEASRNGCKGRGPVLLLRLYLGAPWQSFSPPERRLIRKVERKFRERLVQAGFLPDKEQKACSAGPVSLPATINPLNER